MDNCFIICKRILSSLYVPFTEQFLKEKIFTHPKYPSLLAISDTLEEYKVDSLAAKIGPDRLDDLLLPGIVQVSLESGNYFNVITSISGSVITLFDEKGHQKKISRLDFLKIWTGVTLLVEAKEDASEPEITQKLRDKWILKTLIIISFFCLFVWFGIGLIEKSGSVLEIGYFLLKFLGLSISAILLWYQQNKTNPTLQKFCSVGEKFDCNSILDSQKFQWLNGRLNLSLLGFAYFFAGIGSLSISGFFSITILSWISFLTIPVILYSIYYQAIVIKKWCKFCLMVQIVLILEVLTIINGRFWIGGIELSSLLFFVFLFTVIIIGGILIIPTIGLQDKLYTINRELAQFKSNKDLFELILGKSRKIQNEPKGLGILMKGEKSKYQVIKVSNPNCGPCAQAHPVLENLFAKGNIDFQILFVSGNIDKQKERTVQHFLAIKDKGDSRLMMDALNDWYVSDNQNYSTFSEKYPIDFELENQEEKIRAMEDWCEKEQINYTPTLFINGYELPKEYNLEDLKYILI
ncbi:vitamin K epoxide reductase family protein [Algoriphagus pacificus]|uniref:Thioredoxin domain-containing protein n=1 Tax=Algoriphagus pacificus TaxID=2811234 RepID=A0ABS3CLQ4_9BACT|nr:vitamin K epoxide reductase family protein [Algoriphagus pacificus]MBN7818029.1 thioredoxin domain-containing protein [Algoriphagus pacificus]